MQQSRIVSLIEALFNTIIGFVVSYLAWPVIAGISGLEYSHDQHWLVIVLFTVLSVVRSYVVRRFFNAGLHSFAVKLARMLFA